MLLNTLKSAKPEFPFSKSRIRWILYFTEEVLAIKTMYYLLLCI